MSSIQFHRDEDLITAFATPITRVPVLAASDINPGLKAAILQRESESPTRERSNHGGWQSQSDLLTWPIPEIRILTEAIYETIAEVQKAACDVAGKEYDLSLNGWANICRQGAYHSRHNHATSHWSGVYYVDAGGPNPEWPRSGVLEFADPRERVECAGVPGAPFGKSIGFAAETGLLTVFPGWLYHWVNPYYGPGERVSISFNSTITPVKTG